MGIIIVLFYLFGHKKEGEINNVKKSRIRETPNLSTDADSSTNTCFFPVAFQPKKKSLNIFFYQKIAGYGQVLIKETEF